MRGSVRIAVVALLVGSGPAGAVPLTVMFETTDDDEAGDELAFVSYPEFDSMIDGVGGTSQFSQINVNPFFNTTGLTFDGSNFIVMFETIDDEEAGDELAFVSYPSFESMIAGVGGISIFSQINVNPFFDTTGLTWDGSNYIIMFETIDDDEAGDELAFVSYPSFESMIAGLGGTSQFSQINVNPFFNSTGLMAVVDFDGGGEPPPVPLPPALALMLAGLAGLAGAGSLRGRRSR
jgi:hypothetical protein